MEKEKSAGAIIFRKEDGKKYYLLLHSALGHWDFPKGHIEKGEEEKETALREVLEETGIKDIEFIEGFKEKNNYFFKKKLEKSKIFKKEKTLVSKEVIFYLAKTQEKNVQISFEHIGYRWVLFNNAIGIITFDNAKEVFKKANSFIEKKDL